MSKTVHDLALSGANKICNCSNCGTGFQCERKAWQSEHPLGGHGLPLFGKDTVCRLMDCPVQHIIECNNEIAAEAHGS